jgi:hypothetical protein
VESSLPVSTTALASAQFPAAASISALSPKPFNQLKGLRKRSVEPVTREVKTQKFSFFRPRMDLASLAQS